MKTIFIRVPGIPGGCHVCGKETILIAKDPVSPLMVGRCSLGEAEWAHRVLTEFGFQFGICHPTENPT